jgi:hypothetical protein
VIDLDATLLIARSAKQGAAATFRGGFEFHPMLAYLDGSEKAPVGMLRPGNATANTAVDQIAVLDAALAQLPRRTAGREPILVRADSAGATHALLHFCRDRRLRFTVGFDLSGRVRTAILALDERAWPHYTPGGSRKSRLRPDDKRSTLHEDRAREHRRRSASASEDAFGREWPHDRLRAGGAAARADE